MSKKVKTLISARCLGMFLVISLCGQAHASLNEVQRAYQTGQYFTAARMAFNEATHVSNASEKAQAYAWTTLGLVGAGLDQSAFYFFVRTLQQKDRVASKMVLDLAPLFMERVGPDLLRKFMTQNTGAEDYSVAAKSAYGLVLAKERLLKSDFQGAIQAAAMVQRSHALFPVAMQIRGTANAMLKRPEQALQDFKLCEDTSEQRRDDPSLNKVPAGAGQNKWISLKRDAAMDLQARCIAGQARIYYETGKFEESDRAYDRIPKASFVWTDTLFEHAWATFGKQEYNRTLGKLVSYKSPALQFVFNSEIEVLRAQSYMAMCLYADAQVVIDDFNRKYGIVAKEMKDFVSRQTQPTAYYSLGKKALLDKLHTQNPVHRFLNRFVRSPYFQTLSLSEDRVASERNAIARLDAARTETSTGTTMGFPGFLNQVLDWRVKTLQELGGIFVKNSILDYHQVLINDFEKIQFMKIDLLSAMKKKITDSDGLSSTNRQRGNRIPFRRDDQLLWSFNGEFWNDEIGDYVFALNSECDEPVERTSQP